MSASREKKQRHVLKEQGIAPQQLAAQAAAKETPEEPDRCGDRDRPGPGRRR